LNQPGGPIVPFKNNACRRHCIGKTKLKVTNWAEIETGLRMPDNRSGSAS